MKIIFICLTILSLTVISSNLIASETENINPNDKKSILDKAKETGKNIKDKTVEGSKALKDKTIELSQNLKEKFKAKFLKDDDKSLDKYNKLFTEDKDIIDNKSEIDKQIFSYIAKTEQYSVIMVCLLNTNAPDKVLSIMEYLPIIGSVAKLSRKLFSNQISWVNNMIKEKTQKYVMTNLINEFKINKIKRDTLIEKIDQIPDIVLDKKIKDDSIELLNKYYN